MPAVLSLILHRAAVEGRPHPDPLPLGEGINTSPPLPLGEEVTAVLALWNSQSLFLLAVCCKLYSTGRVNCDTASTRGGDGWGRSFHTNILGEIILP